MEERRSRGVRERLLIPHQHCWGSGVGITLDQVQFHARSLLTRLSYVMTETPKAENGTFGRETKVFIFPVFI